MRVSFQSKRPKRLRLPRHASARLASPEKMDQIIRQECDRADRSGREFSLVLFSMSQADRRPRKARQLARTILWRARLTDEVGWLTEQDLCVLLPDTTSDGARVFADSACELLADRLPRPQAVIYSYPGRREELPLSGRGGERSPAPTLEAALAE